MSSETLARPYARAIFEHSEGLLEELGQVVNVIHQPNVTTLIDSPKLAYKEKAEMFIGLFQGEIQKKTTNKNFEKKREKRKNSKETGRLCAPLSSRGQQGKKSSSSSS